MTLPCELSSFADLLVWSRREGRPLVAVHRGTASGLLRPNTAAAGQAAVASGGDIVELDVVRSRDGVYYTFHDGYEDVLLGISENLSVLNSEEIDQLYYRGHGDYQCGRVERFEETLSQLPNVFINVDRAYRYFEAGFLDQLAAWGAPSKMLVKTPVNRRMLDALGRANVAFPVFPVLSSFEEYKALSAFPNLNVVGYEILAESGDSPLLDVEFLQLVREDGKAVFLNALNLENQRPLLAGYDDTVSVSCDPALGWGKLVDLGADVIQTDWPWLLRKFLDSKRSAW